MKFYRGIITLCILGSIESSNAFITNPPAALIRSNISNQQLSIFTRNAAPSSEDSAKAFTEYMAKSHEEKLKALKDLEEKKNNDIEVRDEILV